jgi:hypothetical protein
MTMPHDLPGGFDSWHLALFAPALFYPGLLAYLLGALIVRRGWHPPIGWAVIAAAVIAPFAVGVELALLLAWPVSMFVTLGWIGAFVARWRIRHNL